MAKTVKNKALISNKQARRDFLIGKTYEAGIELLGNEVKSLRAGKANLKGSFIKMDKGEVFIVNMHINPYKYTREDTDPIRERKLLLHKAQIAQLEVELTQKGCTIIPLKLYFKRSYAKVEIGVGKGKKLYDKRRDLKKKESNREIERALRHKNK